MELARVRAIRDLMGPQQHPQASASRASMLGHIDEGHGQLPGGLQDGESQGRDQDHIAGRWPRRAARG